MVLHGIRRCHALALHGLKNAPMGESKKDEHGTEAARIFCPCG